jgi:tubulin polyglutamylase TTLL6/13
MFHLQFEEILADISGQIELRPLFILFIGFSMLFRLPVRKPPGLTVNLDHTMYQSVDRCVRRLGHPIVSDPRVTVLFWYDGPVTLDQCLKMKPWQFVNHFPGTFAIANKVALARNIEKLQKWFPDLYNFHPKSFALPTQLSHLKMLLAALGGSQTYIVKPALGSQGRGIFLVQAPEDLADFREAAVAQEYVSPFLIGGLKFDLRIYVLLTSVDPLRVYIFRDGMARFCTEPYRPPDSETRFDVFRHLTNYSVNKHNESFKQNRGADNQSHKRAMSCVFAEIERSGGDVGGLAAEIDRIIILTIISAHAFLRHNYRASCTGGDGRSRCFEILGFDILIDSDLKPWVLEVNHSPSLSCDSGFDLELKEKVISGALRIADIPPDFMESYQRTQKQKMGTNPAEARQQTCEYSYERELRLAGATGWRRLFPGGADDYQRVVDEVERMSTVGLPNEQAVNRHRTADQERAVTPTKRGKVVFPKVRPVTAVINPTRPTRSFLLLREARKAKLLEDLKAESGFMFSLEYEKFVQSQNSQMRSHLLAAEDDTQRAVPTQPADPATM